MPEQEGTLAVGQLAELVSDTLRGAGYDPDSSVGTLFITVAGWDRLLTLSELAGLRTVIDNLTPMDRAWTYES